MTDAVFSNVSELLGGIRFFLMQRLKRIAYLSDKAILSARLRPSLVVFFTILLTLLFVYLFHVLRRLLKTNVKEGLFAFIRSLPITRRRVQKESEKMKNYLNDKKQSFLGDQKAIESLPTSGWQTHTILSYLKERIHRDVPVPPTDSKVSGTVYLADSDLETVLCKVYEMHALTNPLHSDIFPSVRQMEAEVVSMCGHLLNASGSAKNVCGSMTGGGTESILSAVKASRDFMKETKGVLQPEMIVAQSAHPAYHKAAEYFNIKLIVLKVDYQYQMPLAALRRRINTNTILMVASAPGFPHGVIDPVEQMSRLAHANGVLLHVDCCLGGLFLPFARSLGYEVPVFDFTLKGVTSISVDTHKYGMSHKGTSVVLYRSAHLRKYQFTSVTDWTGGLYVSPGMNGSRSGALIATAWASLVYLGENGLANVTGKILKTIEDFKMELEEIPDLEIIGQPIGPVVAFKFKKSPDQIYKLHDLMNSKGWHLNLLQFPPALHIAFTGRHTNIVKTLIQDIRECVEEVKRNHQVQEKSMAAIYGTACSVPDRRIVRDLLDTYQDCMLRP